jgi:hypothetical protein
MVKYFCDDCGAELNEYDNIANQLGTTNHVYCCKCIKKHTNLYNSVSWTSTTSKDKVEKYEALKQHIKD